MRLTECLRRENNNYDLLRLAAACLVIVGHAYALVPAARGSDWVSKVLHFDYSGSLAVKFFFFLSGLVVTNSLLRKPDCVAFLTARIARIFPGLIVCVLIAALGLGPLVTNLPLRDYLCHPDVISYVVKNITLALQWNLPGVFTAHPNPGVNGSLWTLPIEVFCYLVLFALGLIGVTGGRRAGSLVMTAIIAYALVTPRYLFMFGLPDGESQYLPALFAFGALLAINQDHCRINFPACIGLGLLAFLLRHTPVFQYAFYAAASYGVLVAGASAALRAIRLPGDFSYGVYLYGWPIQQMLVWLRPDWSVHRNQAIAIVLALAAGALSWFAIERPCIRLGRRLATALSRLPAYGRGISPRLTVRIPSDRQAGISKPPPSGSTRPAASTRTLR